MLANSGHVMTLANGIIGVGILAMPFCFLKCGIVLAIVLLIVSNWVTRLCCHYLIKASLLTRRKSFEFLGFHAFGSSGKLLVELCIIGYLLGTCITYFVVVGDLGPQIVTKMFALGDGHLHLRTIIMIAVTLICILPLGMLKNVDSLSTVCTASIGFYVCLVLKIVLESEENIVSGNWTDKVVYWEPAGVLQCLPIFSMALSCQMQLFEVFSSVHNQSQEKLNGIVRNATWICTFVYIAVGFFGYVAFCTQTFAGNIMLNFSPSFGSDVIKIGFILSVAFSFPLVIFPCRASIYSLLYRKGHMDTTGYIPEMRFKLITVFIVGLSLCIALMIPSVELVIGLVGSTIGVAICIMFPAAVFRKIVRKDSTERLLGQFILIAGFCLMILGTYANLSAIDETTSGAHLEPVVVDPLAVKLVATTSAEKLVSPISVDFLDHMPKKGVDEVNIKTLDNPLPVDEKKSQENSMKAEEPLPLGKMDEPPAPAPPLPVDDNHDEVRRQGELLLLKQPEVPKAPAEQQTISSPKTPQLSDLFKPAEPEVVLKPAFNLTEQKKLSSPALPPAAHITPTAQQDPAPALAEVAPSQQTIAQDAIKKDDEVAAEESKAKPPNDQNNKDDELKKTQNELKETKKLLERTVDELKEELAKQNKETQNLVVEKLGEVAEKVHQIEQQVQHNEEEKAAKLPLVEGAAEKESPAKAQDASAVPPPVQGVIGPAQAQPAANKSESPPKLGLSDRRQLSGRRPPAPGEVYEPLSYKTGELIEHARNHTRPLDTRLPLPLALLLNASNINMKRNNSRSALEKEVVAQRPAVQQFRNIQPIANEPQPLGGLQEEKKDLSKEEAPPHLPREERKASPKEETKDSPKEELHKYASPLADSKVARPETADKVNEAEKENVEAIRRDILQLDGKRQDDITTVSPTADAQLNSHRRKRASGDSNQNEPSKQLSFSPARLKLDHDHDHSYLLEPKLATLLLHGQSNALDVKMHGFVRELKSLHDGEAK